MATFGIGRPAAMVISSTFAGLACWALAELLDALRLPLLADNTPLVLFLIQPGLSLLLAGLLRLARVPLATLQVTLVGAPTLAGWAPLLTVATTTVLEQPATRPRPPVTRPTRRPRPTCFIAPL